MSAEIPTARGRNFWDFCSEHPITLIFALSIIGLAAWGSVAMVTGHDLKFRIGPEATNDGR